MVFFGLTPTSTDIQSHGHLRAGRHLNHYKDHDLAKLCDFQ